MRGRGLFRWFKSRTAPMEANPSQGPDEPVGRTPTDLELALGHTFSDVTWLDNALVHRSHDSEPEQSNERLEFLGDAVLGLVVTQFLFRSYSMREGEMAKVRATVVTEGSLAAVARQVGLGTSLRLSKGEQATGGRDKDSILADAMEAVIGAVYLDGGLAAASQVVLDFWQPLIAERSEAPGGGDYKTRLQELLAVRSLVPSYTVGGTGPDHDRHFEAQVSAAGEVLGTGAGTSKKRAEQAAAEVALRTLADDA